MNPRELLERAYQADPIACYVAVGALFVLAVAFPFRRGGVDARFIISVFATLATIGTVPRIAIWAGEHLADGADPPPLSGTDCVLAAGGLLATVFVAVLELKASFVGRGKGETLAGQWWAAAKSKALDAPGLWGHVVRGVANVAAQTHEEVGETPEAAAERKQFDQKPEDTSAG